MRPESPSIMFDPADARFRLTPPGRAMNHLMTPPSRHGIDFPSHDSQSGQSNGKLRPEGKTSSQADEILLELAIPDPPPPAPKTVAIPRRTTLQRVGVILRRTVGLSLLAAALWWLALPLAFPVTSDAIVNARTVQVRAPIDGSATELTCDVRDSVAVGQPMARLDNRQLDRSGLIGMTTRRAEMLGRRERLEKELGEVAKSGAAYQADADKYKQAVVSNLESAERECKSREESVRIELDAATRRVVRLEALGSRTVSESELEAEREKQSVNRSRLALEQASLTKCKGELEAARRGLYIQKDAPHFQQKADEMALRAPQIRAELKEIAGLLATAEIEIAREAARTERLAQATVDAPVGGTVWTRQGNRGQGVKQNEVLYEIADSGSVFVEAVVHQRHLSAVAEGTPATVNITGGPSLSGRVRAVRSGRPKDNEPTFAFAMTDPDPKMLRVLVELDAGTVDPAQLIGRHVRVLIADPVADPCRRAVVWLFANARL